MTRAESIGSSSSDSSEKRRSASARGSERASSRGSTRSNHRRGSGEGISTEIPALSTIADDDLSDWQDSVDGSDDDHKPSPPIPQAKQDSA